MSDESRTNLLPTRLSGRWPRRAPVRKGPGRRTQGCADRDFASSRQAGYMAAMDPERLDLNLLRVLEALLAERHVTRAAARLGLTQSAVSNALRRLRAAFDDELFQRTPAGME